jgi:hypothetical protein
MRYAVIHCRNVTCLLKVWVPSSQLGRRGCCPGCGCPLQAPSNVPPGQLVEGPAIMQVFDGDEREHVLCNGLPEKARCTCELDTPHLMPARYVIPGEAAHPLVESTA